jgi:hypothetical protein
MLAVASVKQQTKPNRKVEQPSGNRRPLAWHCTPRGVAAMTKGMFELKPEELRAVIGGATYYTSVNKLPALPTVIDLARLPPAQAAIDRPTSR